MGSNEESADLQQNLLSIKTEDKENLLVSKNNNHDDDGEGSTSIFNGADDEIKEEVKKQLWLAGPLIGVSILQYSIQVISVMFVGHLGELPLSSASIATSFASVTGASVLCGMGSALETLCGQSYGAKNYKMLGIYTQRAMISLLGVSVPLAFVWYYTDNILLSCGQDAEISKGAGIFNRWMIPTLFGYSLLQCFNRFFQTQHLVFPMLLISSITTLLHVGVCRVLIFKLGLGIKGVAMANNVSYWVNAILMGCYIKYSSTCSETWTGFSRVTFRDVGSFFKLGIPSAMMMCLEFWTFEMVVLLSGLLPNPELETSVLSISLNTCYMVYMISVGLGGAISTRVSNELGAGHPYEAKLALKVMMTMAIFVGLVAAAITILVRHVWGRLYSNEEEVVHYVAKMMLLLALSDFMDGFQCVLSGAARGCGWQKMCACINLGAYYLVGIPSAVILSFVLHFGGMGLWMGIICGLLVQIIALVTVNLCTDWEKEAVRALLSVEAQQSEDKYHEDLHH